MVIGICDDNEEHRKLEKEICEQVIDDYFKFDKVNIFTYEDGSDVLKENIEFDILILDIEMSGQSGIDVKKELEERNSETFIIFVTSHDDYVFESVGINVYGFVRKSYLEKQLRDVFKSAYNKLSSKKNIIIDNKYDSDDVMVVKVEHVYSSLLMNDNNEYAVRTSMKYLEEKLENVGFIRISRNMLINMSYVKKMNADKITLMNENIYEISVRRTAFVKKQYRKYCEINGRFY